MSVGRRRFLSILAGCALSAGCRGANASEPVVWRGRAFGARAEIQLLGTDRETARRALTAARDTIRRLETLFSLYQRDSELNHLNATGHLTMPPEFARLIDNVERVNRLTDGLFDPTVQPLMVALATSKNILKQQELQAFSERIGWNKVWHSPSSLSFSAPQMALTLNGIAQGFATDRVTEVLRSHGFDPHLVHIGEFRAGAPTARIAIAGSTGSIMETVDLREAAIATSAPFGMRFENGYGHIVRPDLRLSRLRWRSVTVMAERATEADAFSTALALAATSDLAKRLAGRRDVHAIWLEDTDGSRIRI